MLKKLGLVLVLVLAAVIVPVAGAAADGSGPGCEVDDFGQQHCGGGGEVSPGPGDTDSGNGEKPAGFTPGPQQCVLNGNNTEDGEDLDVSCSSDGGWWSNENQCYWTLDDPQSEPPAGKSANVGAWYQCVMHGDDTSCEDGVLVVTCYGNGRWMDSPPPGVERYTPGQAAALLAASLTLKPIDIGLAPNEKTHSDDPAGTAAYRRTWVGIPVWAWVDRPSESTWGPITRSDTYGGVTVSGTATVQSLVWDTGDGQQVACGSGTEFSLAYSEAAVDSPNCGWRYEKSTHGGTFTVSATTVWKFDWTAEGETGTIAMPTTTSSTQVRVGELQSVNVANPGDSFTGDQSNG